jgi:ABC-type Mn2+/Zn2+ transport system ATPase subunit/nucleotidyltransferase/DNA polymerase involved in DNA repair
MQLTDVRIDQFGTLKNVPVEKLSPRVTLFWGPNGSGKSTFVRFLRGLLFGYRQNTPLTQADLHSESGIAHIQTPGGRQTLHRVCSATSSEQFTITDQLNRSVSSISGNSLPTWVTEEVFREIFTVGYEEAERFELLTRLCMESGTGRSNTDPELRQAEAALVQTLRDRDGSDVQGGDVQGGVVRRMSELRRRQEELQHEIATLRRPAADLPGRIEQLVREIDESGASLERIDIRIRSIDAEIVRLEQLLVELRRRNVLPLNRPAIEGEIRTLTARLDRWREIRGLISRTKSENRLGADSHLRPAESSKTIRAIVSRLEERAQTLTERLHNSVFSESQRSQEADVVRQLRGEIASLCSYLSQHEQATARHFESLQATISERAGADAAEMERLLEAQIATLRDELTRSENVLADNAIPKNDVVCRFTGHQELTNTGIINRSGEQTIAEVEAQLERLRSERIRLVAERASLEESRSSKRILLERLRQELAGTATLEQLDTLRSQIAQLDAEIVLLEDHRRQLDRTEASLREVIERLKGRSHSRVLELASQYVQRLTEGECRRISAALPARILVQTNHNGEELTLQQLSRGTRDQVGLALRLALIQVRSETHGRVPLILDDVFVTSDDARANAAVMLLTELAQQGQQILFFTCQKDVRDLFARFNADVRTFDYRAELPKPAPIIQPPISQPVLHAYVEPPHEVRPVVTPPVNTVQPAEQEIHPNGTNWLFYLEVDHGVEDLAGITLGELEALRTSGILTIDDILDRTVPQIQEAARLKGFLLSVDRLHALRGQAELTTRVPMLRRSDAALLYAAGIRSVEELSRLRPETVYDRVSEFQRSESGSRYRRGGRLIDRQQSINWARFGQFTRTLSEARQNRSRFSVRSASRTTSNSTHSGHVGATSLMSHRVSRAGFGNGQSHSEGRSEREDGTRSVSRRRRVISGGADVAERRARRLERRRRQSSRLRTERPEQSEESDAVEQTGGLRFFLNRTSHIEKAPSIGPRTASKLEAIGIHTVEDLMSMTAERISEKLSHRRMTAEVIQQWQHQSRLMCQVPELRGHDAQILVACGITTPEDLAAKNPASLLSVVEPFSKTKEGERIIRNGKNPDLAEVTEWVQWAANARSFKAA